MALSLWLLLFFTVAIYLYLKYHFNYWKRKGVPSPPANLIFGNLSEAITLTKSLGQIATDIYNKFENHAYVGFYKFHAPAILLRDPELIKSVLLKDFPSFHDNDFVIDENSDFILARNLVALKGQRWKTVRNQLTPGFTSKKVKAMFPILEENCLKLVSYIDGAGESVFEAKELTTKYTTENVATCAFGLNGKCFEEENPEFREIGRKLTTPSFWVGIQQVLLLTMPFLSRLLHVKFVPDEVATRLTEIISETLEYRKREGIVRNDYLDFLSDLHAKLGESQFSIKDLIAHAAGFYTEGFETSSIVLTFTMYEIASNLNVQSKLREEIDRVTENYEGKLTYEGIQEMTYLDCVFWEGIRKHPVVYTLQRMCTKNYAFPNGNGPDVQIQAGTSIWVPVEAIQADANYFPNPNAFDPDRFSGENKNHIKKCTLLGFGEGPRICLGQNFGIAQVKLGIATLVRNYEMRVNEKTRSPLELDPNYFMRSAVGGIWLDFYRRTV